MGVIIRQSIFSSLISYLGIVVGFVNVLYLYPRYLEPDEIGLVRVIQDMAIVFAPFAQIGISQAIIKFLPEIEKEKNDKKGGFFVFSLVVGILGFCVFSLIYFTFYDSIASFFAPNSPELIQYLYLILLLTLVIVVFETLVAYSKLSLNLILPSYLKEINTRILVFVWILIFTTGKVSFEWYVYGIVGIYITNVILISIYLFSSGIIKPYFSKFSIKGIDWKPIVNFGLYSVLGAGGALIIGKVDSIMVSGMLGLKENGIYTTAFFMAVVIEIPKRMISQISMPIISKSFAIGDLDEVKSIYKKTALNQLIFGLFFLLLVWLNIDNIYAFIPNSEVFSLGKYVVLLIGIGKLIDMAAGSNGEIIVMSKDYRVNIYMILVMAVLTIFLNYIFIPIYGIEGAAIGSGIAYLFFNLGKFIFLKARYALNPFSFRNLIVLLIGLVTYFLINNIPSLENYFVDILLKSFVTSSVFLGLIYVFKLSPDFNQTVQNVIRFKF